MAHLTPVAAQVLKVAHHGSAYSSGAAFLAAVGPADAVISVGPNSYGHPAPETLARLQAAGARVWRTDRQGTILLVTDGLTYGVTPEVTTPPDLLLRLYLPAISKSTSSAPTATPTMPPSTPTHTPSSTRTPVPAPTSTPTPLPGSGMPGQNVQCQQINVVEICASVSNATPARYSTVTVYGRLRVDGAGWAGQTMNTTWHYKTTTSACSGTTGGDGLASCRRGISSATAGYQVNVDVFISGYQVTASFTPH